jgi:hypothetical protein
MKVIDINIDKEQYLSGETVNGRLINLTDKEIRLKNFEFKVIGEEKTLIPFGRQSFSSANIFFEQDLSSFLSLEQGSTYQNKILYIPKGIKQIPFKFTIPKDVLQSYAGKKAFINYVIYAEEHKTRFLPHINEKLYFKVIDSKKAKLTSNNKFVIDTKDFKDISLKIETEGNEFYAGNTLRGRLIIDNHAKKKINGAHIIIKGFEYAIGEEDSEIEIETGFGLNFTIPRKNKKTDKKKEIITKIEEHKAHVKLIEGDNVPFEIGLPEKIKRSYVGKISKYYWIMETKIDISWLKNFHAETLVNIV